MARNVFGETKLSTALPLPQIGALALMGFREETQFAQVIAPLSCHLQYRLMRRPVGLIS